MSITKKGTSWEIKNSLWIILNFIILIVGIGTYYAGRKTRVKKWRNYGLLSLVIMWASFFIIGTTNKESIFCNISVCIFLVNYIACIGYSFKIRKEYLIRLEMIELQKIDELETDNLRIKIADEYGVKNSKISTAKLSNTNEIKN